MARIEMLKSADHFFPSPPLDDLFYLPMAFMAWRHSTENQVEVTVITSIIPSTGFGAALLFSASTLNAGSPSSVSFSANSAVPVCGESAGVSLQHSHQRRGRPRPGSSPAISGPGVRADPYGNRFVHAPYRPTPASGGTQWNATHREVQCFPRTARTAHGAEQQNAEMR